MNCRFKNKGVERKLEYERGVASGVDTMLIVFTYVLSCYGYKGIRIQQIVSKIEDVCDSINKGYITHQDLEDELWNEYQIRMKKRKEWLQGDLDNG
jgi:hypothetical protein